jgi:hypothetical protein
MMCRTVSPHLYHVPMCVSSRSLPPLVSCSKVRRAMCLTPLYRVQTRVAARSPPCQYHLVTRVLCRCFLCRRAPAEDGRGGLRGPGGRPADRAGHAGQQIRQAVRRGGHRGTLLCCLHPVRVWYLYCPCLCVFLPCGALESLLRGLRDAILTSFCCPCLRFNSGKSLWRTWPTCSC